MRNEEDVKKRVKELTLKLILEAHSEREEDEIWEEVEKLVPDPDYSGYIFYPNKYGLECSNSKDDLTDEELKAKVEEDVDRAIGKAFSYKPIIL